ncbi:hypothetical protein Hanom_Chr06g00533691 [Helianthus anomalus]
MIEKKLHSRLTACRWLVWCMKTAWYCRRGNYNLQQDANLMFNKARVIKHYS